MEFSISKDELIRALGRAQGVADKRSTNPIIANVLLDAGENTLCVSATDTELSLVARHPCEVQRPGRITLSARQLYDIARTAGSDKLRFVMQPGALQVEINAGRSTFRMMGLSAEEFPPIPSFDGPAAFHIDGSALKDLIDRTSFAISPDDTRTGLNGAHVETYTPPNGAAVLRFVATDGHRLSLCGRPFAGDPAAVRRVLLPKKGLLELRKLCDDGQGPFAVSLGTTTATFQRGALSFGMRLLEGEFPDYQQVIPPTWQRRLLTSRDGLVQALRRVSILTSEKTWPVRFQIAGGGLCIVARQAEVGDAKEDVEAQVDGADLEIGFNAKYFSEALAALSSDTAAVEIGDSLSPCLIKPGEGEADELFVIMPMRLE